MHATLFRRPHLSRDSLEPRLRTLTLDQGRAAYLAYGSVREAVTAVRLLGAGFGVRDDAIAHAVRQIRAGARHVRRLPGSRALSGG
jgi:hypothetical protein